MIERSLDDWKKVGGLKGGLMIERFDNLKKVEWFKEGWMIDKRLDEWKNARWLKEICALERKLSDWKMGES